MSQNNFKMSWIDTRQDDVQVKMGELRKKLSPNGNIVSPAGKKRTLETFGEALTPHQVVNRICDDVAAGGLTALLDYNKRIDHADLTPETIRVSEHEMSEAHAKADPAYLQTIKNIKNNICAFQQAILHKNIRIERPGGFLVERYRPLRRVGICVPGGAAAYPSTLLMTAVPAQVAGVTQIAVMAPPTDFGANNPDLLAACWEIGVREVYRMGGAQGVAAFAYGVTGIERVDKIVGPGNLFVALAKQRVYGEVDIDAIAGPSEVVVIVDESTHPEYTAYDMMAQAEHSPGASILIGWDKNVLLAAEEAIGSRLATVSRGELARQSLEDFGAIILTRSPQEACEMTNLIAPEHLHIATKNAEALADQISCAGAIFLGNFTPVALGDYAAGPSHVLPTSGTARFTGGLTCNDFLRANSIISFSQEGLERMADDIYRLATIEGLTAHRESVEIRRKSK
ncbi:MAG: histidinol dehydrogenase [Thermoguttaceae bacterium]|nr:histidinol dehydrogenase [Thermoguttaceae bacterium]